MTQLSNITSLHWQHALGGDGIVEMHDDIRQSIHIILRTPIGSEPLRPEFGSEIYKYIDWPINRAKPHVVREAIDALARWEPRIKVISVDFKLKDMAHACICVKWQLPDGFNDLTEVTV